MRELSHLSEISNNYATFIIDLWGVMHNGIKLNFKAMEVIENLKKISKKIVFLSNAPRPSLKVINFLQKMGMEKKYLESVITSGEAAMHAINQSKFGKTFFHLGPPRDISIFDKVKKNKTNIDECDFILCTGLFDDYDNDLNFYREFLKKHTMLMKSIQFISCPCNFSELVRKKFLSLTLHVPCGIIAMPVGKPP